MPRASSFRPIFITVVIGATIIAIGLAIGLSVGLQNDGCEDAKASGQTQAQPLQTSSIYPYAAVTSDSRTCSDIGAEIMARHQGNAIDAGIATLLCIGAMCSHSGGVGGGSFAVLYDKQKGWHAVDFRETAPSGATQKMFFKQEDQIKSKFGGLAIGVPGELRGALEMHARFGTVPWRDLVMPTVKLLRDGFILEKATWKAIPRLALLNSTEGFEMFINADKERTALGSIIKMPKLAKTFQTIADDPYSFYNGSLAQDIVKDIQDAGGIITLEDLKNYKANVKVPTRLDLPGNMTLHSMPAPGSGPVMAHILSVLYGYKMGPDSISNDKNTILSYHRIVEAMKFAFAKRSALGDEDFVDVKSLVQNLTSETYGEEIRQLIDDAKTQDVTYYKPSFSNVEDAGTAHMNAMDGAGNAISITSTVNHYFGSKVVGSRTGIIFNNEMDDFSTPGIANYFGIPPSPANFIEPGKRPMSSMCPTIVWDHNRDRVCLVTGGAGGSRITTATALAVIDTLWFNMSVAKATENPRFHHQLLPDFIKAEETFPQAIKSGLEAKGHKFESIGRSVVNTLGLKGDDIEAAADFRKGGKTSGF